VTRVLWLAKGLGRGGTERLITSCVPHLSRRGFEVEVAYLLPEKDAYVPRLESAGVTVHCLSGPSAGGSWPRRLRRLLAERDFALLHTHSPLSGAVARLAAPKQIRFVHTEHNMWERYRSATRWANAATFRRNDAVIAVSRAVADSIPSRFCSPALRSRGVDVVLHGIDLEDVTSGTEARTRARAQLGLEPDALVVGTVGNLTEKKNHPLLVEAFRLVHGRHPGSRLVIIGGGPLEQQLRERVRRAGIEDVTLLTGSRDDASELVSAFDVFALSSRFEGLSIALVEALAAGIPTVATHVGGVPEVLHDSAAGWTVPDGDQAAFAANLDLLLSDPALRARMSAAATARAAAFGIRPAVASIERIYHEVLAG
jgi:glycosyltransferase involved in cell wall biosynthesis